MDGGISRRVCALLAFMASLPGGTLRAQIRGTVVDDSGRADARAMVDLTGPRVYRRVGLTGDGRFVFRDVHDTSAVWAQAFDGARFSSRLRVTPRDTALQLALRWPPRTGLAATRTILTPRVSERGYDATQITCQGPACALGVTDDIGRIHCWSTITGARQDTVVEHVWYWQEREMARVRLAVRGPRWRTWSSKKIAPGWSGTWRVEVVTADGTPLAVRFLTVESTSNVITSAELARTDATNAFDVIQRLRLRWLGRKARGSGGSPSVRVNGVDRGTNWSVLYAIARDSLQSIRWRDSAGTPGTLEVIIRHPRR
jgi:hypothetical protein